MNTFQVEKTFYRCIMSMHTNAHTHNFSKLQACMHAYTCSMNMHASTHTNKHVQKCKVPCMCPEVLTSSISTIFFKFLILLNYNCKDVFDNTKYIYNITSSDIIIMILIITVIKSYTIL